MTSSQDYPKLVAASTGGTKHDKYLQAALSSPSFEFRVSTNWDRREQTQSVGPVKLASAKSPRFGRQGSSDEESIVGVKKVRSLRKPNAGTGSGDRLGVKSIIIQ